MERPRVTLHFAQSLDGRIATRSGAARWISGPPATRYAHELRAAVGAVIVGSGTALADDPLLTVRHVPGASPLRVVLDGRGRLPESAKLLASGVAPTLHVHRAGAAPAGTPLPHVERWVLPAGPGGEGMDSAVLLARLARRGVGAVLVEGGSGVLTSFLRAGLCDRLVIAIAPIVVGAGIDAVGELFTDRLDQALGFTHSSVTRLGDDVVLDLSPAGSPAVTFARAVWFERPGVAALRREPLREPGPGEVRVRALCSGVSAGTERLVLLGRVPVAARASMALPAMRGGFEFPIAYGYATVGVVEAGERAGERVFVLHPHQDVFVCAASALRPLPAGLPAERLVLAANLETAINVVWDAEIGLGDRVVVAGLGVVGLLVARLARRAGAAAVLGVDRDPARAALAVELGATAAVATPEAGAGDLESADVLIEASGLPALLSALVASAGPEARVVVASWYGDAPVELPLGARFHPHRVTLRSSQVAGLDARRRGRWTPARRWALASDLLADEALDRLIAPSIPLSEAPALYDALARGAPWCPPQRVFDSRG